MFTFIYSILFLFILPTHNPNGHEYENCERWISERYLTLMQYGIDSFTVNDKINIALLANSCPVAVGNCVYIARSINAILQPGMQYNDDVLCAASLPASKNGNNPYQSESDILNGGVNVNTIANIFLPKLEIFPNPNFAGGQLTIAYNLPEQGDGKLHIYDMVGKLVQRIYISSEVNMVHFNLDNSFTSGSYKVTLFQGNKLLTSKKLSIGN